ncbi:hypothetical protein ACF0H5_006801 [Mactra antiquata]
MEMTLKPMLGIVFYLLLLGVQVAAIKRYYATESCGHVHGPDTLTVIEFDKNVQYEKKQPSNKQNLLPPAELRNTEWTCIVVVRGIPHTTANKSIGIQWRDFHVWDTTIDTVKQSVEACGKAYVTIYQGPNVNSEPSWTLCGKDTSRIFLEWPGDSVTIKFYADFRWDDDYKLPEAPKPTCINPDDAKENDVTALPLCPTPSGKNEITTTPILDTFPYPEVHFRVDITSFDYSCNASIPGKLLKCNDSQRCIDESLVCDFFFSQNCKSKGFPQDKSDQTKDAPAYCSRKPTTTPRPTTTTEAPEEPIDWTPVIIAASAAAGIFTLCWCCIKPGYLYWRLARARNWPLCNTRKCVCCRTGPTKCCSMCASEPIEPTQFDLPSGYAYSRKNVKSRHSIVPNGYNRFNNPLDAGSKYKVRPSGPWESKYGQDPNNFATEWLNLISGDGGHLREQR